jgi:hypothetical protein
LESRSAQGAQHEAVLTVLFKSIGNATEKRVCPPDEGSYLVNTIEDTRFRDGNVSKLLLEDEKSLVSFVGHQ